MTKKTISTVVALLTATISLASATTMPAQNQAWWGFYDGREPLTAIPEAATATSAAIRLLSGNDIVQDRYSAGQHPPASE